MLNKEEKRLFETYILPLMDRAMNICNNDPNEIYGDKYILNDVYDKKEVEKGKNGLYVAFSKIWNDLFEAKRIIETVIDKNYVESLTIEQKININEKKIQKEDEMKKLEEKNKEKLLKEHKKQVISDFLQEKQLNFEKIIKKKELDSFKKGVQESRMSDKEILYKAEYIKLNNKLLGE